MSLRMKIANDMRVIGTQILSASNMVRMNEASAMRADTAAVSEVGGDSSPQIATKKAKQCATQGSMPSVRSGGTTTTATMLQVAVGGRPEPASQPKTQALPMR